MRFSGKFDKIGAGVTPRLKHPGSPSGYRIHQIEVSVGPRELDSESAK